MNATALASSLIVVVADGVRSDTLRSAIDSGAAPALASLQASGGLYDITTVFPSVTGLAYLPFLAGRHPATSGLPGLRWYDRSRGYLPFPHYTRSYIGWAIRHLDRDIHRQVPTLFEIVKPSLGSMTMLGKGLRVRDWVGRNLPYQLRGGLTHFRGSLQDWLKLDRFAGDDVASRITRTGSRYTLAAFLGIDKASHAEGHEGDSVAEGIRIVDEFVARVRDDAEREGRADSTRIWVVSDHGHSPVRYHEDLAGIVEQSGYRVIAHPWVYSLRRADVAVMVSGNAMAHVYLALDQERRPFWPALKERWTPLVDRLLALDSVDLMLLPLDNGRCDVRSGRRGSAVVENRGGRYSYIRERGDPLGIGQDLQDLDAADAYAATIGTDYPDSLVQIAAVTSADRSGEIILSASRLWDFRARYEPIPHLSSHGALHREHMKVPLLLDRAPARAPLRTVDLMPAACDALGIPIPPGVEGESFLR